MTENKYIYTGKELPNEEKEILLIIKSRIQSSYNKFFTNTSIKCPNIALVCSGGGYRAMICFLSCLMGLNKLGIDKLILYISTLSGSTWGLAGLYYFLEKEHINININNNDNGFDPEILNRFKIFLKKRVSYEIFELPISFDKIIGQVYSKYINQQSVTLVDIWGYIIGNMIFGEDWNQIYLSNYQEIIKKGKYPFPFFTCIAVDKYKNQKDSGNIKTQISDDSLFYKVGRTISKSILTFLSSPISNDKNSNDKKLDDKKLDDKQLDEKNVINYEWMQFNPYNIGFIDYDISVNTKYFNSQFYQGNIVQLKPEMTMSNLLGFFGSAFCVDIDDFTRLYSYEIHHKIFLTFLKTIIDDLDLEKSRISSGKAYNFGFKIQQFEHKYSNEKYIRCVDAGIDFNLPFPPLFQRDIDIFIVCDATIGNTRSNLKTSINSLKNKHYKIPKIDYSSINLSEISIFHEKNTVTIIYIPNNIQFSTFKLKYTDSEFDILFNDIYNKILKSSEKILSSIFQHNLI